MSCHQSLWKAKTKKFWIKRFFNLWSSTGLKCSLGSQSWTDSISTKFHGLNFQPKMKMLATSPTKTKTCFGKCSDGCLKTFLSRYSGASSTAQRSRKNTLGFSTTVKQFGLWSCPCQSKTYKKLTFSQSKKKRWLTSARIIISRLVSSDWSQRATLLDLSWHSIVKSLTPKTWQLIRSLGMLTWCWKIWSPKCSNMLLVSQFSTMTTSWKNTKNSCRNGNLTAHQSFTLWRWISKSVMIMSTQKRWLPWCKKLIYWRKSISSWIASFWKEKII